MAPEGDGVFAMLMLIVLFLMVVGPFLGLGWV